MWFCTWWYVVVQGYDMEDAMVLNKASVERGFAHGSIYKGRVSYTASLVITVAIIFHFFIDFVRYLVRRHSSFQCLKLP